MAENLTAVRDATYLYIGKGACINVRVGRTSFTEKQVLENVLAATDAASQHLPRKWAGIQSIHLKTADSVALPLYASLSGIADGGGDAADVVNGKDKMNPPVAATAAATKSASKAKKAAPAVKSKADVIAALNGSAISNTKTPKSKKSTKAVGGAKKVAPTKKSAVSEGTAIKAGKGKKRGAPTADAKPAGKAAKKAKKSK